MRETTDLHLSPSLRALALAILGSATVLAVAQAQTTQPTTRPAAWHFGAGASLGLCDHTAFMLEADDDAE